MRVAFAGLVAAQSMIFSLAVNLSPPAGEARIALHSALAASAVVVFLLVGIPLLRTAAGAALRGRIVFEQLFLAGIFGAFAASLQSTLTGTGHIYYEVVAILLAIYTFGGILRENRRNAAMDSARALGREFDTCERVDSAGLVTSVPIRDIARGDIVLVPAGTGISVDGIVIEGAALVGESSLTGEPFPVVKRPGDEVRAGSHSIDAAIRVRVTVAGGARQLDGILSRVAAAQSRPSQIEREADRLVAWFLPAVFAIAAATFCIWTARSGWAAGLFNALAVILVACPCSMGLATPIGIWSAMADLARRGLVATSSDLVERLAAVDAAVFDKTGTLTGDQLELVDFVCAPGIERHALLAEVAAVEAASGHPVARAFRRHASALAARDVRSIPGVGIAGRVGNADLQIGNDSPGDGLRSQLRGLDAASHVLGVLRNGAPAGAALLRENLRDHAREVIAALEAAGIPCTILTGDRAAAAAVRELASVRAGLSPLEKTDRMRAISSRALFVGDGINDAPAMADAFASLCLASGSGIARDIAMGELRDLRAIPFAIARSRWAIRAIRRNLLLAAGYNFIGIALAAGGVLHPVAAALLMLASSLTVSTLAMRKPPADFQWPAAPETQSRRGAAPTLPQPVQA